MSENAPFLAVTDLSLLQLVPLSYARTHRVLPVERRGESVRVACAASCSRYVLDELGLAVGGRIVAEVYPEDVILETVNIAYAKLGDSAQQVIDDFAPGLAEIDELAKQKDLLDSDDDAPVIKLLNSILAQAVRDRASDIHIEPYESYVNVRFRIDGVMRSVIRPAKGFHEALCSRVKILAELDIAEKRLPQDGRMSILVAGKGIDIRVSVIPSTWGERVVLRLLSKERQLVSLANIGLAPQQEHAFRRMISRSSGIVLVTGPTGSGKTTTLYACLNLLNSPEKNIITIEDPVEYQMEGIGQIQVNPKIDLTFADGLRSILRQDPDIVMVGEIRDRETADIAMQASLTGHLVLSTLHTNDAATAITRLVDMGVEPFKVASSLSAVLAQRLVRKICVHCRETYVPEQNYPGIQMPSVLFRGRGCDKCGGHGTLGRIGIYELLVVTPDISSMIARGTPIREIRDAAQRDGMRLLLQDGLDKVAAGVTTIDELLRVTQEDVG